MLEIGHSFERYGLSVSKYRFYKGMQANFEALLAIFVSSCILENKK